MRLALFYYSCIRKNNSSEMGGVFYGRKMVTFHKIWCSNLDICGEKFMKAALT